MADDMKIIKKIGKQIRKTLPPVPLEKIKNYKNNGYSLNGKNGQVTGLNLDDIGIKDISLLKKLNGLTRLSLSENQITDLSPLAALTNLIELNLSENHIKDIKPLAALTKLIELMLSDNKIIGLTPLTALTGLKELYLVGNHIIDLTPLAALTKLTNLNLSLNQIIDFAPLAALTELKELNLTSNQITDLLPLSTLTNLSQLYLSGNQISDLLPLAALTDLTELYLSGNQISDLSPLAVLKKLELLSLIGNRIITLTPLQNLKHLIQLELMNNRVETLPSDITTWWPHMEIKCEKKYTIPYAISYILPSLNLYANPLKEPPIEIVKQGNAAIENYFTEIRHASVLFLECKILLVGSGDVGKTTLMKKLIDDAFEVVPGTEGTTRGIDIQPWHLSCPFPDGQSHDVKIHFWDFGGQDILHATHQFFLTKRSLYLIVWDPRKEEENRSFDYWLNAIKLLGAGSPAIMVMNKADMRLKHIDEASLQEKYPNIAQFHQISCLSGHNIPELIETIRSSLTHMPHLLNKLPKRWKEIRDRLKTKKENYISLDDYLTICHSLEMDKGKALFLSDYLHDLGIILHFRQDPVLSCMVILKPEWATGAVYALIDSLEIQQNRGRFSRACLNRYWDVQVYPLDKHEQLLRLMEKFELSFKIVGSDDYIIPELLPSQRPPLNIEAYRSVNNLRLFYSYIFMPAGIITRFICRLYYLRIEDYYWKNGVELEFSNSKALVVSDATQKRIQVFVSGSDQTQLMGIIRSQFDHIHETMNMEKGKHFVEEVPCNCSECKNSDKPHLYKYHVLQKFLNKGIGLACEKSAETIFIPQLIQGLQPPQVPDNIFEPLITSLTQLQGIQNALQSDENSRNTVLVNFLKARGVHAFDQTLYGSSRSGIMLGELDIKIEDKDGRPLSIIEALNLTSVNTNYIDNHILKLLKNYDNNGLKENYILAYVTVKNFGKFCRKYRTHLETIDYRSYTLRDIKSIESGFNKIKLYKAWHRCISGITILYHLLVKM